jgi:hypothetical protein
MFWFSLQILFETFLKTNSARHWHKCTYVFMLSTHYSCRILIQLEFSRQISKNTQIPNLIKIRPVDAELFHADGQTDMKKLIVVLCNIAKAPKTTSLCGNCTKILSWKIFWRENKNGFLIELMFRSEPPFFSVNSYSAQCEVKGLLYQYDKPRHLNLTAEYEYF